MGTPGEVVDLGRSRFLLDLKFRDTEGLVAAYLLPASDGWALIETGPTTCHEPLLAGIAEAGVDAGEVRHVLVTHIHLDHAGGVGALAKAFPRAAFYAHESGVPHLADPSRLIVSARRAWGAAADPLWGPIPPTPRDRLVPLRGGEAIPLRDGELTVVATPGHARHHIAFFDTHTRGLYTGDAAGVRLPESDRVRPALPPPDLDLAQLFASLETLQRLDPRCVYLSHFGPSPDGAADLVRYRTVVERWRDVALTAAREGADPAQIARRLREEDTPATLTAGDDREGLVSGYDLAAQGLLRYFETRGLLGAAPG